MAAGTAGLTILFSQKAAAAAAMPWSDSCFIAETRRSALVQARVNAEG